jgi:CheY-like chemotaxis protein
MPMRDLPRPLGSRQPDAITKETVFLIVDDFEPMRKVTMGQLRAMGARSIVMANNGAEALRTLKKQRVDIVLSDWNMPVMTGFELLKAIRSDPKLARLPFIMITAEAERHRIEEAIAAGVSDLLVKPYTADRLTTHVEKALVSRPRPRQAAIKHAEPVPATGPEAQDGAGVSADISPPTILVVDDTPDNLLLLSHLFQDEYRVRIAHSGEKALDICQSNEPPDLVLLDIMMPGMDGFEVARLMRQHPTSEAIPVIFVTAMTGDDARLKGLELGAVDFVSKPIDPNVLKPRVRNFMRYVALHKRLQADFDGMLELARLREDVDNITRHDMKGPLAGVIGLVQAMADDDATNRRQAEQLRVIEETTLQVLDMINLSSELFKIETGRFKLDAKPVRVDKVLRRIIEIAQTTFAEKRLAISLDTSAGGDLITALGDDMLCYSLFHNLIKNACEAAPDGSAVSVSLGQDDPLSVTIRNTGAVPAEVRDRFFDKFVTHGKQGGTGLGTYSARMLAEAQQGSISLEVSDPENQTTIIVKLPRDSSVATSTGTSS